jgi:Pyruvate/2-oxoacid:ferredoxin oxidoreductase delta subunit
MPALPSEVGEAEKDGVKFYFLVAPKQIIGENGYVKAVECLRMTLGEPDASGRRRPMPLPNSERQYPVDTVIPALGQVAEPQCIPTQLASKETRVPLILVDPLTLETPMPGVFAGGDVTSGPASIIEAVGAGKKAATSINLYLTGQDVRSGRAENIEKTTWAKDWNKISKKQRRFKLQLEKPQLSIEEALDFMEKTERDAKFEACRCLGCGPCAECLANTDLCEGDKASVDETLCIGCNVCAVVCPFDAVNKDEDNIARISEDTCKGCGICAARCPVRAITMKNLSKERIMSLALASCKER